MRTEELISAVPIQVEHTVRADEIRALTSCRAGKIVPVAFSPVLREDRVSRGEVRISLDMAETVHPLMNAINVTAYAHLIPNLAFERFDSMTSLNRSYMGEPEPHSGVPIKFVETINYGRNAPFWKTLGVHWVGGQPINRAPLEAYNVLVNWRRKARSKHLPLRTLSDTTLAEAFWKNSNLWHIVPDFDQAMMDGEVELQLVNTQLPVYSKQALTANDHLETGVQKTAPAFFKGSGPVPTKEIDGETLYSFRNAIFAEMRDVGAKVSLANIEQAKRTVAFAKLMERYEGIDADYVVDLLMQGVRVPEEAMKQPILLDRKSTVFGYTERKAMDGPNLDVSVTTGATELTLTFRTPPINTGGVILITLEIVPEKLFERMDDYYLRETDPTRYPNFMRDYLDPEKVEAVENRFVDVLHSAPDGIFGYAPLNHAWKRSITRIGGRYFRPLVDSFVEDRQRFWSVETLDPELTTDFYLVTDLPHTVFADNLADPFEVLTLGRVELVGNTVFGETLEEDSGAYDRIASQVDTTRIVQE